MIILIDIQLVQQELYKHHIYINHSDWLDDVEHHTTMYTKMYTKDDSRV